MIDVERLAKALRSTSYGLPLKRRDEDTTRARATRIAKAYEAAEDIERWYAAYNRILGSEANTIEGKRRIYERFAAAYAAGVLADAQGNPPAQPATTDEDSETIGPVRFTSANCRAGDHEYCASMVEQDVPELGITDCLCDCHAAAATTDEEG